jgi:hypothetical protein
VIDDHLVGLARFLLPQRRARWVAAVSGSAAARRKLQREL